ncbi:MAG: hypothetical protein ISR99_02610 [Parcubacteria group bacterium]|nr:hypothetical protein [Parcubacteria group bacterium]
MSIRELLSKIKQSEDLLDSKIALILIVILVGFGAFGMGRMSTNVDIKEAVEIDYPEDVAFVTASLSSGEVVASKNGSKYHFPWCSGALRIAEQNKVEFSSIDEARLAGYAPAANCKGLK